ncbi:MAG: RnfABCDGE type electron transport complex subunit D [Caldicoprobacterales bacterium]|jgi:Na+-transporting NADH:ubiquinone oxidoreductase subunit B
MSAHIETKSRTKSNLFTSMKTFFRKQPMMRRVLLSLIPILLFTVYMYGWRVISVLTAVTLAGVITEYIFEKSRNGKPTESILVSCFLFTLILPPKVPYWVAVTGIVFAVVFGKQVFGGFGRNVFNPAITGRVFVFITFPGPMTNAWVEPFSGFPGGFARWVPELTDGISAATPLAAVSGEAAVIPSHMQLILGNVSGSMGESAAILILIAAVYLIATKTASWKIISTVLGSALITETILHFAGVSRFPDPLYAVLSGGLLFGAVFMATDPITAPRDELIKLVFGTLTGVIAVLIREFSLFKEGTMFAILTMNTFVPLMEITLKSRKKNTAGRRAAA